RQQHRHLDRADAYDAQHADRSRRSRRQRERVQSSDATDARARVELRHGGTQPVDHAAGVDDRLSQRLQADVLPHPARRAAFAADSAVGQEDAGRHADSCGDGLRPSNAVAWSFTTLVFTPLPNGEVVLLSRGGTLVASKPTFARLALKGIYIVIETLDRNVL